MMKLIIKENRHKPTLKDLTKKLSKRLPLWIAGLIGLILIDEWIKEGYLFNFSDLFVIGTHEFLIAMFSIIGIIWIFRRRYGDKRRK
jgi:hypothetical protein